MDDIACDGCGRQFPAQSKVAEIIVNAHTSDFERTDDYCPECAEDQRARRTHGTPDAWFLKSFIEFMEREYGEPLEVIWVQGDEHKILLHIRRPLNST